MGVGQQLATCGDEGGGEHRSLQEATVPRMPQFRK